MKVLYRLSTTKGTNWNASSWWWCQEYDYKQLLLFIDSKNMKTSGLACKGAANSILESKW